MRTLSQAVFGEASKPYKIEMLLFLLAPSYIVNEIKEGTTITIKQPNQANPGQIQTKG